MLRGKIAELPVCLWRRVAAPAVCGPGIGLAVVRLCRIQVCEDCVNFQIPIETFGIFYILGFFTQIGPVLPPG